MSAPMQHVDETAVLCSLCGMTLAGLHAMSGKKASKPIRHLILDVIETQRRRESRSGGAHTEAKAQNSEEITLIGNFWPFMSLVEMPISRCHRLFASQQFFTHNRNLWRRFDAETDLLPVDLDDGHSDLAVDYDALVTAAG